MATNDSNDAKRKDELTKLGYERSDVSLKFVVSGLLAIAAFAGAAAIITKSFLLVPAIHNQDRAPRGYFKELTPPPGSPILQTNITRVTDIRDLRQNEMREMTTYAYADKKTPIGVTYRIPIQKAIDIVAKQGINATQNYLVNSSNPVPGQLNLTPAGPGAGMAKKPSSTLATGTKVNLGKVKPGTTVGTAQKAKPTTLPPLGGKTKKQ